MMRVALDYIVDDEEGLLRILERFAKRKTLYANHADSAQLSAISISWPMAES